MLGMGDRPWVGKPWTVSLAWTSAAPLEAASLRPRSAPHSPTVQDRPDTAILLVPRRGPPRTGSSWPHWCLRVRGCPSQGHGGGGLGTAPMPLQGSDRIRGEVVLCSPRDPAVGAPLSGCVCRAPHLHRMPGLGAGLALAALGGGDELLIGVWGDEARDQPGPGLVIRAASSLSASASCSSASAQTDTAGEPLTPGTPGSQGWVGCALGKDDPRATITEAASQRGLRDHGCQCL